jgi:methylated-DNA-[protein]-cysteine S-methyltransferase
MAILSRAVIETPLGGMLALASPRGLVALEFDAEARHARLDHRLARFLPDHRLVDQPSAILDRAREWLARYFRGESADVSSLPLDQYGAPFERKVWRALVEIPAGETDSYGGIARKIGDPGAARAVGLANGANPIAIVVPCHRVIGSNGSLTGYGGGLERKRWLLNHEARWRRDLLRYS